MFKSHSELPITRMYEEYFWVKYSYLHSRSTDQIRLHGIRQSEDDRFRKVPENETVTTQLNIAQLFDLHRKGVTVRLTNYNDSAKIYEIIQSHLKHAREYIATAVHMADEEFIRELIELDAFASVVYEKAVNVFSDEDIYNFNSVGIPFVQRLNSMNVFKRKQMNKVISVTSGNGESKIVTKNDDSEKTKILERSPLRDSFAQHLDQLSGWSKSDGKN